MRSWQIIALLLCGFLVFVGGCSGDSDRNKNNRPGNHVEADAGEDSGEDSGEDVDEGADTEDVEPDVEPDEQDVDSGEADVDPGECGEFCGDSSVVIESASGEFPFTHAAYGFTSPRWTGGGWELHVELWEGGFEGCPVQDSPSPSRTMIFYGLSLDDTDELVLAERLALTLLDYDGLVFVEDREIPFIRAVSVAAEVDASEFCTECLTNSAAEGANGELVVRLEAEFERGNLHGEMRAKYCESMNEL